MAIEHAGRSAVTEYLRELWEMDTGGGGVACETANHPGAAAETPVAPLCSAPHAPWEEDYALEGGGNDGGAIAGLHRGVGAASHTERVAAGGRIHERRARGGAFAARARAFFHYPHSSSRKLSAAEVAVIPTSLHARLWACRLPAAPARWSPATPTSCIRHHATVG